MLGLMLGIWNRLLLNSTVVAAPAVTNHILTESGVGILLESGDNLALE